MGLVCSELFFFDLVAIILPKTEISNSKRFRSYGRKNGKMAPKSVIFAILRLQIIFFQVSLFCTFFLRFGSYNIAEDRNTKFRTVCEIQLSEKYEKMIEIIENRILPQKLQKKFRNFKIHRRPMVSLEKFLILNRRIPLAKWRHRFFESPTI